MGKLGIRFTHPILAFHVAKADVIIQRHLEGAIMCTVLKSVVVSKLFRMCDWTVEQD